MPGERPRSLDELMPTFDAVERHSIRIAAPPSLVDRALRDLDLRSLPVVRGLLFLRALPAALAGGLRRRGEPTTLVALERFGFGILRQIPNRELVLGVAGRFWRPTGNLSRFDAASFAAPVPPGEARALWDFRIEELDGASRLSTETRVLCGDAASRRKFRLYWLVVRPFSGLIRRRILGRIRELAEHSGGTPGVGDGGAPPSSR